MNANTTTLEQLRDKINAVMEEKKRNDDQIVSLRKEWAERMSELHHWDSTLQSAHPDLPAAVPVLQPENKDILFLDVSSVWTLGVRYVLPAVLMFAVLWLLLSRWREEAVKGTTGLYLPSVSFVETAQACSLFEDIRDRRGARLEARSVSFEPLFSPVVVDNYNKSRIHLAIVDVIASLNSLDTAYMSNASTESIYEDVQSRWAYLVDQYIKSASVEADEGTELEEEQSVPKLQTTSGLRVRLFPRLANRRWL